ncbi:MAG: glycosyltransferase family 1 protein [Mariniphaga sp.]
MKQYTINSKTKIKLFVDAHVFDGIPQGTVTYLSGLYSELIKDERFILFVGSNDKSVAVLKLGSTNFIHIQYKNESRIKRLLYTIPQILKSNEIDYAHFQYISPIQKRCKYIVTTHDLLFLEFPESFPLIYRIKNSILFYLSAKRADVVTTVSQYSKESIHRFFKIPMNKIKLVPNGVKINHEHPEPFNQLKAIKFILLVSRIEPRKNQALLIKIWKELNLYNQEIDLVIVGSEGIRDVNFFRETQDLSDQQRIHFHWFENVTTRNLDWMYQNCYLFVFPSSAEGFGIPPLEAAIHGAKVLCSNTTAMKDFNFWGHFNFNPNSVEEFKTALSFALTNKFNHLQAIETIKTKYNWERIAKDFANLICKDTR